MQQKLKLGVIEVLNVLPVYYGIVNNTIPVPCDIHKGKVTELNQAKEDYYPVLHEYILLF